MVHTITGAFPDTCMFTNDWLQLALACHSCLHKRKWLCVCRLPLDDIITCTAHTDCYHKLLPVYSPWLSFFQSFGNILGGEACLGFGPGVVESGTLTAMMHLIDLMEVTKQWWCSEQERPKYTDSTLPDRKHVPIWLDHYCRILNSVFKGFDVFSCRIWPQLGGTKEQLLWLSRCPALNWMQVATWSQCQWIEKSSVVGN